MSLVGPGGLLSWLTKTVLETSLEAELAEHLGYEPHDPAGQQQWQLPQRDPDQDGADCSLSAKGLTQGEISAHFAEV